MGCGTLVAAPMDLSEEVIVVLHVDLDCFYAAVRVHTLSKLFMIRDL